MARILVLVTLALASLPGIATAAPGDFDEAFGGNGIVPYEFTGGYDSAWGVLVQPDGKIVVGGETDLDLAVARIEPDSGLDNSFSLDGLAAFPGASEDYANAVARQPDGKLVLAGQARGVVDRNANVLVMRTNRDGTLDGSFGTGGIVTLDFGNPSDVASDVLLQPDGKIVLVGRGGASGEGLVARLTAQGQLDPSFSDDGINLLDFGGADFTTAVALAPDGKLVVGGYATGLGVTVVRLHSNGLPDPSFGTGGFLPQPPSTGDSMSDLLVQPDGKIVLTGNTVGDGFLITRLKTDGSFDESLGDGEGLVVVNFGNEDTAFASGLALQANGKIVVAGYTVTGMSRLMAVARLQPGGALDTTFSGDGRQNLNGTNSFGNDVAIQPNGKIVVAGDNDVDMLVVRLEGDPVAAGGGPAPIPGGPGGGPGGPGGGGPRGGVPRCSGKRATIVGTNRSERLKGTRRADVIVALGGNDKIAGGKGNDVVCGGNGNDTVDGGLGNDRLFGQDGKDKLAGAAGKDTIDGGAGKDKLSGGGGRDGCIGGAGKDRATCERERGL